MITRSKSRALKQQVVDKIKFNVIMDSSNDNNNTDAQFEVNNQLGLPDIFNEGTQNGVAVVSTEARGLINDNIITDTPQNVDIMEMLRQLAKQMSDNTAQLKENNKELEKKLVENAAKHNKELEIKLTKNHKELEAKLAESNRQLNESIRDVNRQIREELAQQIHNVRQENQENISQLRSEVRDTVRGEVEVIRAEINGHLDEMDKVVKQSEAVVTQEVKGINKKIENNNKKQDEKLTQTKAEILRQLKEVKESSEGNVRSLEEKYGNNMEEVEGRIRQIREDVRTRIDQAGVSRSRTVPDEYVKNVVFNGEGEYPMEFLKELEEIEEELYRDASVNWVQRHLVGGAAIWWRIVKNNITTFAEFKDAFVEKYWNYMIQEEVRDRLEFGRYRRDSGLSMVQHMERCVLQNRQLIPPISDEHLIRKLSRHFSREIEVSILTRGVKTISGFQSILMEFNSMRSQPREKDSCFNGIKTERREERASNRHWLKRNEVRQEERTDAQGRTGRGVQTRDREGEREREREDTRPMYKRTYTPQVEYDPVPGPSGIRIQSQRVEQPPSLPKN